MILCRLVADAAVVTSPTEPEPELTWAERRAERSRLRALRRERRKMSMQRSKDKMNRSKGKGTDGKKAK